MILLGFIKPLNIIQFRKCPFLRNVDSGEDKSKVQICACKSIVKLVNLR